MSHTNTHTVLIFLYIYLFTLKMLLSKQNDLLYILNIKTNMQFHYKF